MDTVLIALCLLGVLPGLVSQGPAAALAHKPAESSNPEVTAESRLHMDLLHRYKFHSRYARPVRNASASVPVSFAVWLVQLLDFDVKRQIISVLVWKEYSWLDEMLSWDPGEYDGVKEAYLHPNDIWTPDIVLYNSIDERKVERHEDLVQVHYTGNIMWLPPLVYRSSCPVDPTDFPFDTQHCKLEFGSWSYGSKSLNLTLMFPELAFRMDRYTPHTEWEVDPAQTNATALLITYPGFSDGFTELHFTMVLKRQSGFWVRLVLLPMILLSAIACVVFWIPPHRPDRTTISMNLFSSFFLLLLLIVQSSPPTTSTRMGTYCTINIAMVALATVISVVIVNIYQGRCGIPAGLGKLFCAATCKNRHKRPTREDGKPQAYAAVQASPRRTSAMLSNSSERPLTRHKVALVLDIIFFLIFLTNFIVSIVLMFPSDSVDAKELGL